MQMFPMGQVPGYDNSRNNMLKSMDVTIRNPNTFPMGITKSFFDDDTRENIDTFMVYHNETVDTYKVDHNDQAHLTAVGKVNIQPASKTPPMETSIFKNGKWRKMEGPWSGEKIAVLVHGINANSRGMTALARHLEESGAYDNVIAVDYNMGFKIDDLGRKLADTVKTNLPEGSKIHFFSHSMGGLVTRSAIENHGIENKTELMISMGTPHNGTKSAFLISDFLPISFPEVDDLSPDSDFLKSLNDGEKVNCKYYTAIGTESKFPSTYWTVKYLGDSKVANMLGTDRHDGMVPVDSASYDLSGECREWESKTFPVNHTFIKGGKSGRTVYEDVLQQIDKWAGIFKE